MKKETTTTGRMPAGSFPWFKFNTVNLSVPCASAAKLDEYENVAKIYRTIWS